MLKISIFIIYSSFFFTFFNAQFNISWLDLAPMPMRVANNAVVQAFDGEELCVYSFAGIDSTKLYSGIHLKAFKYKPSTNSWSVLPDLPDTLGKIAAGASVINNKIYIVGGYHVFANGNELSSNKVHVFNPITNQYESDASPIPVPIDDHVQCVYQDSLLYVVTGWSNTGNVSNVQIYNANSNEWLIGTPPPANTLYQAFGASGVIIGDAIYYHGGVKGGQFSSVNFLRKGVINPANPTEIQWSQLENNPGLSAYRTAAFSINQHAFWFGGSSVAYNYDGIAYNGSGGVAPQNRLLHYNTIAAEWNAYDEDVSLMDLRGIAKLNDSTFVLAGGMIENQTVTNRAYLMKFENFSNLGLKKNNQNKIKVYPNPVSDILYIDDNQIKDVKIYSLNGELLIQKKLDNKMDVSKLAKGFYIIKVNDQTSTFVK